ncbi:MAG: heme ABC exporter ATP-binding protein CcmA [Kiloniellales bacterium]
MTPFEGRELTCVRGERRVFAGLSFALPPGGALILTGPNGSGKSSLLRLMAGLLRPAAGQLVWDGQDIRADREAHRARLHYVGHLDAVKPVLSAAENLAYWADQSDAPAAAVAEALDRLDLAWLGDIAGRLLSAGQRRRLALARLLVRKAELWLLDEPTVGLDDDSLARFHDVLSGHRASGGRAVVATHTPIDLAGAEPLALETFAGSALSDLAPW